MYTKVNEQGKMLIVFLYVDDLIFIGDFGIKYFKVVIESEFEMIHLGLMKFFLGIEFQQFESGIFTSQSKYASVVLKRFNMSNCKTTSTLVIIGLKLSKDDDGSTIDPMMFKRLIGSLMHLTAIRPDIMYGVILISIFMDSPKDSHWKSCKIIQRYVSGTKALGIMYSTSESFNSLVTLTVTMEATQMIGKSHMGTHFILVHVLCCGIQRNNPL